MFCNLYSFYPTAPFNMNSSMLLEHSMSKAEATEITTSKLSGPTFKLERNITSRNIPALWPTVSPTILWASCTTNGGPLLKTTPSQLSNQRYSYSTSSDVRSNEIKIAFVDLYCWHQETWICWAIERQRYQIDQEHVWMWYVSKIFFKNFIKNPFFHCLDMNYTTPPPPPCKNKISDATCNKYKGWGICTGKYESYMNMYCAKACGKCWKTDLPWTDYCTHSLRILSLLF